MKDIGLVYEYHFTYISRYGERCLIAIAHGERDYESETRTEICQEKCEKIGRDEIRLEKKNCQLSNKCW